MRNEILAKVRAGGADEALLQIVRDAIEDELEHPDIANVVALTRSGGAVHVKIRWRVVLGRLAPLALAFHGGPVVVVASLISLVMQATSREPLPASKAHICLLLAADSGVDEGTLYTRLTTRYRAANESPPDRSVFDLLLDELIAKGIIGRSNNEVFLKEEIRL